MGPSKRALAGSLTQVYFSFGYMSASAVAYLIPDWRGFTLAVAFLSGLTLLSGPFYPESPRFLYARKRYTEGAGLLTTFAKKTGVDLTSEYLSDFEEHLKDDSEDGDDKMRKLTIFDLFRTRRISMVSINLSFAFMRWDCHFINSTYQVSRLHR